MPKKKNKYYTLIIVPSETSKVRKIKISKNLFRSIFIILALIIAATAVLALNVFSVREKLVEKIAEVDRLKYKINYKTAEFENLNQRTENLLVKTRILENYLSEVEELDKTVRDITGEGGFEEKITIYTSDLGADIDISSDPSEIFFYTSTDDQVQDLDDIDEILDSLLDKVPEISVKLSEDQKNMEDYIYEMDHTPTIWPTWGRITTLFCDGRATTWRSGLHKGLDIANSSGTPITTSATGIVIFAGWHAGYGKKIIIYHSDAYSTVYAHLSRINVEVGDEVSKGEIIGYMGSTGRSTGSHLHYEVYVNGIPKDPIDYME
jgi:murein DD-endopeptidase MepM/ murein hydrolase activator NlpD